jgi:hypothetical protein
MPILWIVIILVVLLLLFGGVGYGRRGTWGGSYGGGLGLIGTILLLVLILWLLGVIK